MDAFYTENIVTEKYGYNMTINLYQDIDAPNPFDEFDTLGTLETFTRATEYRERIEQLDKERSIFVEGSTLETEYVIYASRASIRTAYNVKRLTKKTLAKAFDCLMSERAIYENWLNGGVTGYIVTDDETGEEIDSCWGFYDDDNDEHALEEAREAAENYRRPIPAWAKNWKLLPGLTAEQVGNPFLRVA